MTPEIDYLVRSNLGRQDAAGHADEDNTAVAYLVCVHRIKKISILGGEEV